MQQNDNDVARTAGEHPAAGEGGVNGGAGVNNGANAEMPDALAATEDASALVDQMKGELDQLQDRLLRQAAEFQNYRRRTEQEKGTLIDIGKSIVLTPLLGILDDFSRSLEAAEKLQQQDSPEAAYRSLKEGVDLVYKKFTDELAGLGVQSIEAVGRPFNEQEHEAMLQQPAPEGAAPGTVLNEFQKGYRLGDRVLRHSKVVVAS